MGEGPDGRRVNVDNSIGAKRTVHAEAVTGDEQYEPIDLTIKVQLIERDAFCLPTELKYRDESGQLVGTQDMIEDVYSRDSAAVWINQPTDEPIEFQPLTTTSAV